MDDTTQETTSTPVTPVPWYRQKAVKIAAFVVCLPLWAVLIWTDPKERQSIKVMAGILMVAVVAVLAMNVLATSPTTSYPGWETASPTERLEMLSELPTPGQRGPFSEISGKSQADVQALLGQPDEITSQGDFIYHITPETDVRPLVPMTCIIRFTADGAADSLNTHWQSDPASE